MNLNKKIFVKTYGCQMNVYDSMKMEDLMLPHGYDTANSLEEADIVVLNTCHIREKASEKTYSELGRIKKIKDQTKKNMVIVVAGCTGQAEGDEIFNRTSYVDIVVGPQSYHNLPKLVDKIHAGEKHLIELDFIEEEKFDKLPESKTRGPSALISVQEGCDKFCTFCVVPYTRGAEFSRPFEEIYREVLNATSNGAIEVTLLGQNVNAYHGKTNNSENISLARLISKLAEIKNLRRIRYMTSHPKDMTDDLIKLHGSEPKLMPFLHLPIQSGSNKILKAMNRRHSREEYLDIIHRLRESNPHIVLSSDFIVGFPGEDDKDFEDTLNIVKSIKYSQCFSFKYSPRPGTPAASKEQIPEDIKSERLSILQQEIAKYQLEYNISSIGKTMPVLLEKNGKFPSQLIGKSPYMQTVHVDNAPKNLIGKIVNINIKEALNNSLSGEIIDIA